MNMKIVECEAYTCRIHMAGDIDDARRIVRRLVYPPNEGLCVTVEPSTYIYTGGEEAGFVVGLVNYPRFPKPPAAIRERAIQIAQRLILDLCQWSALVSDGERATWITSRPEEQDK